MGERLQRFGFVLLNKNHELLMVLILFSVLY